MTTNILKLNNLLSNAFKFIPSGGTITLLLTATDRHAIAKVQDPVCGMSQDTDEHIFEKSYQGDTSHATCGNGLDLALVKQIADIVHGSGNRSLYDDCQCRTKTQGNS